MSDKELEKLIKDSIDLDFKDISSKLEVPEEKSQKGWFKYGMVVCSLIFIAVGSYFLLNMPSSELEPGENIEKNILNVNKINYEYDDSYKQDDLNDWEIVEVNTLGDLNNILNYNLKLEFNNLVDSFCYYDSKNELKQCNIQYPNSKICITMVKDKYPMFLGEFNDNWSYNVLNKNFQKSKISDNDIVIIQNLDNQIYNDEYYLKDVVNYRTKFIYDGIGYSIETYDLELEEFEKIVESIIDKK